MLLYTVADTHVQSDHICYFLPKLLRLGTRSPTPILNIANL